MAAIEAGKLRWYCTFYRGKPQRLASGAIIAPPSGKICNAWADKQTAALGAQQNGGDATWSMASFTLLLRKCDVLNVLGTDLVCVDSQLWELTGPPVDFEGMDEAVVVGIKPCHSV